MEKKTLPFDAAEHLASAHAQAELLAEAYTSGEYAFIDTALATVLRARKRVSDPAATDT